MAYNITDACVSCGSCADQCPVEAISEGDGKFVIDADVCVSCGACAEQCPVEAIEEGSFIDPQLACAPIVRRPILYCFRFCSPEQKIV